MKYPKSLLLLPLLTSVAFAEVPKTTLFQGFITKEGVPVEGEHDLMVKLCPEAPLTTSCTWAQAGRLNFSKGYYSVILGTATALPSFDQQWYVETSVDNVVSNERIPLTSAPTALYAAKASSAIFADSAVGARSAGVAGVASSLNVPGVMAVDAGGIKATVPVAAGVATLGTWASNPNYARFGHALHDGVHYGFAQRNDGYASINSFETLNLFVGGGAGADNMNMLTGGVTRLTVTDNAITATVPIATKGLKLNLNNIDAQAFGPFVGSWTVNHNVKNEVLSWEFSGPYTLTFDPNISLALGETCILQIKASNGPATLALPDIAGNSINYVVSTGATKGFMVIRAGKGFIVIGQ